MATMNCVFELVKKKPDQGLLEITSPYLCRADYFVHYLSTHLMSFVYSVAFRINVIWDQ